MGWSSCAKIKMVILIYAQLDHSLFEAARLATGGSRRCGYFPWIENVNVVCWLNSIFSSFASLNLQKTINLNCIYLETNFLGSVQLCIKVSNYRTISLLNSVNKGAELLVFNPVATKLILHGLLNHRSTTTQLIDVVNKITFWLLHWKKYFIQGN